MLDLNSIVALAQAGFTREQIYQLSNVQQPQQPQMQPQMLPQMQPQMQPQMLPQMQPQMLPQMQPQMLPQMQPQVMQPVADPQMQPQQQTPQMQPQQQAPQGTDQQKDPFMMLFEQMTGIKKAIQENNISNSQIAGAEPQSTDDILASIIQPTKPKEDK